MPLVRAQAQKANTDTLRNLVEVLHRMEITLLGAKIRGAYPHYHVDEESAHRMVTDRWSVVDALVRVTEEIGVQSVKDWCALPPDLKTWLRGAIRFADGREIQYVGVDPDLNTWRRGTLQRCEGKTEEEEVRGQAKDVQFRFDGLCKEHNWQNLAHQVQSLHVEIDNLIREMDEVPPPHQRIRYDRDTHTVILDEHPIYVEDYPAFKLFRALIDAHNNDATPIAGKDLYSGYGQEPADPRPDRVFKKLPMELQNLIKPIAGTGGGYSLCLPPPTR